MINPVDQLKMFKKVTAPARRISSVEGRLEDYNNNSPRQIIIVLDNGLLAGQNYINKKASELGKLVGMYTDDVVMMYNNYKKAKNSLVPQKEEPIIYENKSRQKG